MFQLTQKWTIFTCDIPLCKWHEWVKSMLVTTQVSLLDKESVREQHVSI
jgi:hypothetical protein